MVEEWRKRVADWFDDPWRVIQTQPVLFLFMWIGVIHVVATPDNEHLGFDEVGFGRITYWAWNVLMLTGPVMVGAARLLIRYRKGRYRVWGGWLRLGGDLAVFAGLAAYLATRMLVLGPHMADSPLFSLITFTGIEVVVGAFVVRDIGALVLLERVTSHLHREGTDE